GSDSSHLPPALASADPTAPLSHLQTPLQTPTFSPGSDSSHLPPALASADPTAPLSLPCPPSALPQLTPAANPRSRARSVAAPRPSHLPTSAAGPRTASLDARRPLPPDFAVPAGVPALRPRLWSPRSLPSPHLLRGCAPAAAPRSTRHQASPLPKPTAAPRRCAREIRSCWPYRLGCQTILHEMRRRCPRSVHPRHPSTDGEWIRCYRSSWR
ncbi:unnamed protein product, partial [Urochloa humidicola]